ncbi:hypothetical protein [Halopseudomonas sp.]|uniref:hypothetical protein n=1 Tax=Halopseudomonas sp. TaxID=2901191 RepID=UPI0030013C1F
MELERIFIKTDLFEIDPKEDEETNPFVYGKQFSEWLRSKFIDLGYDVEAVIPEDWGWCVMCKREPYWLWVGCSSIMENEHEEGYVPSKEEITWHCFATAEVPFLKRIFKKIDTREGLAKIQAELMSIINEEPRFKVVQEP